MRRHLQLVPRKASKQASEALVECLEVMLLDAKAGRMIGLIGAGMYRDMEWEPVNCGEAEQSPLSCYAMLGAINADLAGRIFRG